MSEDPDKVGAVSAGADEPGGADPASHAESEARGAELREELAITDERRAEEEEAKAEAASAAAASARDETETVVATGASTAGVSGAAVRSPTTAGGTFTTAGAEGAGTQPEVVQRVTAVVDDPEHPERLLGAAFVGAFLFARVLKRITR